MFEIALICHCNSEKLDIVDVKHSWKQISAELAENVTLIRIPVSMDSQMYQYSNHDVVIAHVMPKLNDKNTASIVNSFSDEYLVMK